MKVYGDYVLTFPNSLPNIPSSHHRIFQQYARITGRSSHHCDIFKKINTFTIKKSWQNLFSKTTIRHPPLVSS